MVTLLPPEPVVCWSGLAHELRLEVLVLVVDAGQSLAVKHAAVTTVVYPRAALHTLHVDTLLSLDTSSRRLDSPLYRRSRPLALGNAGRGGIFWPRRWVGAHEGRGT